MPCANRSFVTIGSPCAPRLSHRGQINGEFRDLPLVGVLDHQHHPALRIEPLGRKYVQALRRVPPVVLAKRGVLVLDEARLHLLRTRHERRRVEAGEIHLSPSPRPPPAPPGSRAYPRSPSSVPRRPWV